jgi:hypothetical protein
LFSGCIFALWIRIRSDSDLFAYPDPQLNLGSGSELNLFCNLRLLSNFLIKKYFLKYWGCTVFVQSTGADGVFLGNSKGQVACPNALLNKMPDPNPDVDMDLDPNSISRPDLDPTKIISGRKITSQQ